MSWLSYLVGRFWVATEVLPFDTSLPPKYTYVCFTARVMVLPSQVWINRPPSEENTP